MMKVITDAIFIYFLLPSETGLFSVVNSSNYDFIVNV